MRTRSSFPESAMSLPAWRKGKDLSFQMTGIRAKQNVCPEPSNRVGRRQDWQTADPLCRTNPELVCAPHMEVNRPASAVLIHPWGAWWDALNKMCGAHRKGKAYHPFVGAQIDIANAFGFKIPDGCAPKYTSRKKDAPHRGRPAKPKTSELEH